MVKTLCFHCRGHRFDPCPLPGGRVRSHKLCSGVPPKWKSKSRKRKRGFPGGAVVESLPADAGHTGSSPGLGGSHVPRSNWAREPQLLSLRVWSLTGNKRGRDGERPAHRDGEWPPLAAAGESPRTETKTQHSQK